MPFSILKRSPFCVLIVFLWSLGLMIVPFAEGVPLQPLSESTIQKELMALPGWRRQEEQLQRTFTFQNFVEAIAFVNQLVEPCEKIGHHPDLSILYNRVTITLSTHDAGGLTQKDFALAKIITQIAEARILNQS